MSHDEKIERAVAVVPCVTFEHPTFAGQMFIRELEEGILQGRIVRIGWSFMEQPYETSHIESNRPLLLMGSSVELIDFETFHTFQDLGFVRPVTICSLQTPMLDRFELNTPKAPFEAWMFCENVACQVIQIGEDDALTMLNAFACVDEPEHGMALFRSDELTARGEALLFTSTVKATA